VGIDVPCIGVDASIFQNFCHHTLRVGFSSEESVELVRNPRSLMLRRFRTCRLPTEEL
jgi:hypothetical protein